MNSTCALEFPLCADPGQEEALRRVVHRAAAFLLDSIGASAIEAMILTGSLARGEGSVLPRAPGARLLGDIELLVIVRAPFDWPEMRHRMSELGRQATRELGADGLAASVEYAPADVRYVQQRIRPCIFAYDLLTHGKVLWGRRDVLNEIRPFGVEAIPREDALALVMNRTIELLIGETSPLCTDADARAYAGMKTVLDLAGSALAFAGCYVSPYAERPAAFTALIAARPGLRAAFPDLGGFMAALALAARCKLGPSEELLRRAPNQQVAAWATSLWTWEARQMLGSSAQDFLELIDEFVSRESPMVRLKGWIKYCGHPLRPRTALAPLRISRLLLRASPQTLTYAAALLLFQALTAERPDWASRAALLLPVPVRAGNGRLIAEVGALWTWLIRNN